ncbi:hypothetical protein EX30DRAFT_288013, partial [Ascodesmis nigricans]
EEEEEDDYLSMPLPNTTPTRETLTQRHLRQQREREIRGRPKSKAELAKQEKEKREAALKTSIIDERNRGWRLMRKMGFTEGGSLGPTDREREEGDNGEEGDKGNARRVKTMQAPIEIRIKEDRAGIGMEDEMARKVRDAVGETVKERESVDPEAYRQRVAEEREEKRCEGLFYAAQKVAEKLDMEAVGVQEEDIGRKREVPLKSINVLWRGAVRYREACEEKKRLRQQLLDGLQRPLAELDAEDRVALGLGKVVEEELEEEEVDEELESFEEKSFKERLEMIVAYLRDKHRYCFWCKYRYPDEGMDGCPGTDEDSH